MKKCLFKFLIISLGSLALASFFGFLAEQEQSASPHEINSASANNASVRAPTIIMKNITLHEHEKKHGYEFVMTAQEGAFFHTSDKVECCGFTCNILQHGTSVAVINADRSLIDQIRKQLLFTGPVKGTWKDLSIEGCDIGYNFLNQVIKTEKTMTYAHPLFNLSAQKSIMEIGTETIHMSNGVCTEFHGVR